MNRLTRYFALPLLFASVAVSTVVILGEPIEARAAEATPAQAEIEVLINAEEPVAQEAATQRAERAARMRWLVTFPSARPSARSSRCCAGSI